MEYAVEVKNLSKSFRNVTVLQDVNFKVKKGIVFGLLGEVGAGKSTLVKILTSLLKPSSGSCSILGKNLAEYHSKALEGVGVLLEEQEFYKNLTGKENLEVLREFIGDGVEKAIKTMKISDFSEVKVKNYSKSLKKRLGIASTLLSNPELLILDEPTQDLDDEGISLFKNLISKLKKEKITVFMTSSLLKDKKFCDKALFMKEGRISKGG